MLQYVARTADKELRLRRSLHPPDDQRVVAMRQAPLAERPGRRLLICPSIGDFLKLSAATKSESIMGAF
jgi:hypothetical protein